MGCPVHLLIEKSLSEILLVKIVSVFMQNNLFINSLQILFLFY